MLVLPICYWPFIVYSRLFLGKHTLDQVFLGSQLGFLLALFMHFCMRDLIFSHITRITDLSRPLTSRKILWYFGNASAVVIPLFIIMSIYMYILAALVKMP